MLVQIEARPAAPVALVPAPTADPSLLMVRAARPDDMAEVEELIRGFARRGLLLPKTLDQLHRTFREFLVARDGGGNLLGCVALRVYSPDLAEVSALAVGARAHGHGVGRRLMEGLVHEARALGIGTLFALTLEEGFFHRLGFRTVARERFPEKIAADCTGCPRRTGCREITVMMDIHESVEGKETSDG